MTQWAFGFGGWIGVFGGFFLFLNVPHNYTVLLLLLSPWLGAISLYLLMFMTFSWMNVCAQVTSSMVKQEIIVAVLTSFVGVLIVAIARFLIEMERGHRTPAQAAAEESATTPLPPSPPSEPEAEPETAASAASAASSSDSESDSSDSDSEKENTYKSPTVESNDEDREDDDDEYEDTGDDDEATEDTGDESEKDEANESPEENVDSESSLNKARTDSSYENIQTPQLSGIKHEVSVSPIPTVDADV